jgi:hypothetical protein
MGTIQLPSVKHCSFSGSLELKPGIQTLVSTCTVGSNTERLYVTAKIDSLKADTEH